MKSLRLWIGRNTKTLTFIGALIVFATFLFKEAIGQQKKEALDALESAQVTYSIRSDIESLQNRLPHSNLPTARDEIDKTNATWQIADHLYGTMDRNNHYADTLKSIRERLDDDEKKLFELVQRTFGPSNGARPTTQAIDREQAEDHLLLEDVQHRSAELGKLRYELFSRAVFETKRTAKRYQVYTYMSYGLYAMGWGLGLLGRLVGVEGLSSEG